MNNFPIVSIVIPCRNEESYISKCLDSIANSDFPADQLRVYIVDGLSDDDTRRIVENYIVKYSWMHLLNNPQKTTPYALNIGIIESTDADVIIILGAHAEIDRDFVSNCINQLVLHPDASCVGGVLNNISENPTTQDISYAMSSSFGVGNAYFRTGTNDGFVDTVGFGAYKSEVFKNIGLFDEELVRNQDDEFNFRMIKNGYKIFLSKSIKANYYVRSKFNKLFKQYFQYGYWKVYVNTKHKTVTTTRQLIPFCFVSFLFFGGLFSCFNYYISISYALILIIYFVAGYAFSTIFSINPKHNFKIMLAFFLLHSGYGLGYWKGVIDFLLLRKKIKKLDVSLTR